MDKQIYKPKDVAKLMGVTVKSVQRWDSEGRLIAKRTPQNRRYYTQDQIDEFLGYKQQKTTLKNIIYARVSSRNQKDDLKNQIEFLRQFVNAQGVIIDEVIEDIGSGLNYKREKWNKLLDMVMEREIGKIYVTEKDRFIRFGFDWFLSFVHKFGTEIVVVKNESLSPQQEMVQDLISIIHVFSCRVYGLRKYKDKIEKDDGL